MSATIYPVLILALTGLVLAWFDANRYIWSLALVAAMLFSTLVFDPDWYALLFAWLTVIVPVVLMLNAGIRKKYFTVHLLEWYRTRLPVMSSTEREALEAGDVGWEGRLLEGRLNWDELMRYKPFLTDEEKAFLDGPVNVLCQMLDDWEITHKLHDLPGPVWEFLRKEKFFCMIIPASEGGLGFSAQAHSAVVMKIASRCITAAVTVMVPNSLGPGQLLLKYGTERQKSYYLPRLVSGDDIPCFALTAPDAGSDAAGMIDNGVVCRQTFDGRDDVLGIRLNWSKRYITLGPVATLMGLAFKLYDPDHLLGDVSDVGITLALIPADTPGVDIGRRHIPGANPFQNGPNQGTNVFIPIDWIIGGPEYAGKGWRMLMECLSEGRGISLPALSVAGSRLATHTSGAYAFVRQQFRIPVGQFEGVEELLARIAGKTYLMDAARQLTLCMLDEKICPSVATAIIKYHLTEIMRENINDAMDIHGGKAIMLGPSNYLMRTYQAQPIAITVEGANLLTRNMIIFGQGSLRCHPCLMDEMLAAVNNDLERFDAVLSRHISHALGSIARAFVLSLGFDVLTSGSREQRKMSRLSSALAFASELSLLVAGGRLKRRERLSARLGDVLSYLYLGTAAIHMYEINGRQPGETVLMKWAVDYTAFRAREALIQLADNLPHAAGLLVKLICFPLGHRDKLPPDRLDHEVAQITLSLSTVRDRLVDGIYFPTDDDEPLKHLQEAFTLAINSAPVEKKIRQARSAGKLSSTDIEAALAGGIIDSDEADLLQAAQAARNRVVAVDDFAPDEYAEGCG